MKRLIGMFAVLCLLPFLPHSRLLAAVVGGALGLLLGSAMARAVLRALGVEHRGRARAERSSRCDLASYRSSALAVLAILLGGCSGQGSTSLLGPAIGLVDIPARRVLPRTLPHPDASLEARSAAYVFAARSDGRR